MANQQTRPEINNFGSLKKIVGPANWKKIVDEPDGLATRRGELFHPAEDVDVNINVFYRGMPIDEKSANTLTQLLAGGGSRALTPDEIKSLATVMGFSTVGDNQYTNPAEKGSRDYPVFHMQSAELTSLNGRTVLKARGNFQNEKAVPGTEYVGYFFASKQNAQIVEELFYQAPTKGKFLRFTADFENCLKTVEWE